MLSQTPTSGPDWQREVSLGHLREPNPAHGTHEWTACNSDGPMELAEQPPPPGSG